MKTKNIYNIKIEEINSNWTTYRLWKNGQYINNDNLTIEDLEIIQKELLEFTEMFNEQIKYLKEL